MKLKLNVVKSQIQCNPVNTLIHKDRIRQNIDFLGVFTILVRNN